MEVNKGEFQVIGRVVKKEKRYLGGPYLLFANRE